MMNWKPRVRSERLPIASANSIETSMASGQTTKALVSAEDREHAGGVGADAEQSGLSEGDQPGIAEQEVDTERGHAVDRDLGGEARVVDAETGRQHDRDGEQQ